MDIEKLISLLKTPERKLEKDEINEIAYYLSEYEKLREEKSNLNYQHGLIRGALKVILDRYRVEYHFMVSDFLHKRLKDSFKVVEIRGIIAILSDTIKFIEKAGGTEGTIYPDKLKQSDDDDDDEMI